MHTTGKYYDMSTMNNPLLSPSKFIFTPMLLKCIDTLAKRHGEVVRETYEEGIVKKWNLDSFSHGAFVQQGVFQRYFHMVID